jgi:hypothetical protein
MTNLVPEDFKVPKRLNMSDFYARMLSIDDVDKDLEAVLANAERLKSPNEANGGWPNNLTRRQNLVDLGWHEKEFYDRRSFTYTLFTNDEETCLGSIYIYPTDRANFDAKVEMWACEDTKLGNVDDILFRSVKDWIEKDWPFGKVAFVGTEISRDDWNKAA